MTALSVRCCVTDWAVENLSARQGIGWRASAHRSQNEDNCVTFSLGLDFLNEAEKEKNKGKGNSASAPSRFASLSEGEIQQILTERHSGKTKQMTNRSVSMFKGKLNFPNLKLFKIYLQLFSQIVKLTEKLSAKVLTHLILSNYRCSDNSLPIWFTFTKITFKWFLF